MIPVKLCRWLNDETCFKYVSIDLAGTGMSRSLCSQLKNNLGTGGTYYFETGEMI